MWLHLVFTDSSILLIGKLRKDKISWEYEYYEQGFTIGIIVQLATLHEHRKGAAHLHQLHSIYRYVPVSLFEIKFVNLCRFLLCSLHFLEH